MKTRDNMPYENSSFHQAMNLKIIFHLLAMNLTSNLVLIQNLSALTVYKLSQIFMF